ncbi:MAG: 30S ribosomal protein S7 [Planctomycetes bacterium]|nr:30S ribosomal protein S7 [Planctomycetota bacterium]
MSRKFKNMDEAYLKPDVRYQRTLVSKFINCIMKKGKKSIAEKTFYRAMDIIEERLPDVEPYDVFETAVNNCKPLIEVRSKRIGGATYQVPKEVNPKRALALAIRWILRAARSRKGKPMAVCLAGEFMDAYKKEGAAMTERENVHRMAEANKAFAHFAW